MKCSTINLRVDQKSKNFPYCEIFIFEKSGCELYLVPQSQNWGSRCTLLHLYERLDIQTTDIDSRVEAGQR